MPLRLLIMHEIVKPVRVGERFGEGPALHASVSPGHELKELIKDAEASHVLIYGKPGARPSPSRQPPTLPSSRTTSSIYSRSVAAINPNTDHQRLIKETRWA
ncbi:uncharacterized protein LOC121774846 [Salvia splendens]|uniref:uncharacterized protein LOC121774846 n=1 Tax=Salvia splendens TaxID=180675 RepID=UPI001C26113B|nr:uncharacterized protein LOC121774846 [Salvia splendens]